MSIVKLIFVGVGNVDAGKSTLLGHIFQKLIAYCRCFDEGRLG